jgi:NADH-quinone oxidoreductase subunit H
VVAFLNDPFTWTGSLLRGWLEGLGLTPDLVTFLLQVIGAFVLGTALLMLTFILIWAERKIVARIQDRLGPNRVGPFGVFQTVADLLKLVTKELITPTGADIIPYNLAPLLAVMAVVGIWAVIPLAPTLIGAQINVGVLYIVAVGAIGTLGIMVAGMSSNNKYALLGAFRTVAMMVSYAVPMMIALLIPVLLSGSMDRSGVRNRCWFPYRILRVEIRDVLRGGIPPCFHDFSSDGHALPRRLERSLGRAVPIAWAVLLLN